LGILFFQNARLTCLLGFDPSISAGFFSSLTRLVDVNQFPYAECYNHRIFKIRKWVWNLLNLESARRKHSLHGEKNMKKEAFICFITILFILTSTGYAIDYLWKDETGIRIFDCGGHAVGGNAEIKALGDGTYRAHGVRINRVIRADSIYHAAQIVCGEKPEFEPAPKEQEE